MDTASKPVSGSWLARRLAPIGTVDRVQWMRRASVTMRSTSTCTARQQHLSSTASTSSTSARQAAPGRQCLSRASTTAAPARPCTWWAPWQAAPCTWSARPRARCCKVEIPVQFHLPELNFPMRTGEKSDFVPRFVPRPPSCYPPFCPRLEVSRKFFRHIPSAPRAAAQQQPCALGLWAQKLLLLRLCKNRLKSMLKSYWNCF